MLHFLRGIETKWNTLPRPWVKASYEFFDDIIFGTKDVVITPMHLLVGFRSTLQLGVRAWRVGLGLMFLAARSS